MLPQLTQIRLKGRLTEDRRLVIDLPADLPPGDVEVTIAFTTPEIMRRDQLRQRLAEAGLLAAVGILSAETHASDEDMPLIDMPDDQTIDQIISEMRGD